MVIFFNGKNPTLTFSEIRAVRSLRIAGECSAREVCFTFAKQQLAKPALRWAGAHSLAGAVAQRARTRVCVDFGEIAI